MQMAWLAPKTEEVQMGNLGGSRVQGIPVSPDVELIKTSATITKYIQKHLILHGHFVSLLTVKHGTLLVTVCHHNIIMNQSMYYEVYQ